MVSSRRNAAKENESMSEPKTVCLVGATGWLGQKRAAHPQNPLRWAGLQFHALMAAGTCTVGDTHHTRYDGFSPVDVGTWLARHVEAAS